MTAERPSTLLVELTRDAVASRAPEAVAVVPVAACEQHGPHLPLGTDLLIVEHVARSAAARLAGDLDVVVAPSVAVGFSPYHLAFGATLTAGMDTLAAQLQEICAGLVTAGFRRIFLLNGHGGNAELVMVTARTAGLEHGVRIGAGSYWVMAWDELVAAGAQEHGRLPGHAGAFETAVMAALRPDLVRDPPRRRAAAYQPNPRGYFGAYYVQDPDAWCGTDGFSDDPSSGDAQDGRRFLDAIVAAVSDRVQEFAAG